MRNAHRRPGSKRFLGYLGIFLAVMLAAVPGGRAFAQAAPGNTVLDIRAGGTGDNLEINISTSRRPDSSVFTLSSPARLVVDIADASVGRFSDPIPVNQGAVKEIVAKEFRETDSTVTRVTVYLNSLIEPVTDVSESGIRIQLKAKAGQASAAAPEADDALGATIAQLESGKAATSSAPVSGVNEITGLYFQPYEKRSRVLIKGAQPLKYNANPVDRDNQVVIDVTDATIPQTFKRPLDTSEFPSAVKMVSAYPLKTKPNTVRVVIKLRENVQYQVEEKGSQVYFDFPVPASVASRMPATPVVESAVEMAPAGTASDKPTLISSSGQVSDAGSLSQQAANSNTMFSVLGDPSGTNSIYTGRKISIDVREADIHNVFRMIANVSKLNIVTSDNVVGKVTVRLQNVPWDQALAVILQSKGLGAVRLGNIIRIAPLSVLKEERQQQLEAVKASQNLEQLQTLVLPLNFANVSDIRPQIEAALSDRGKVTLDTRTNALILEDTASGLSKVRQLVVSLDTQTPQVLIEARIVEVSSTFLQQFGIQWGTEAQSPASVGGISLPSAYLSGGTSTTSGTALLANSGVSNWVVDLPVAGNGALSLNVGQIAGIVNIDARLSALENIGKGKVISAPKVMTVDNRQAFISQGTRIPYETVSSGGTQVQFIEATLRLEVTPHITTDNRVFLRVRVTNNRPDFGNQVNGQPAIEIKEAQTEVMVKDGDTTVLGGVYTLSESESISGLPGLHKVPFLGWLFKSTTNRSDRKELLVFITPHVVSKKGLSDG